MRDHHARKGVAQGRHRVRSRADRGEDMPAHLDRVRPEQLEELVDIRPAHLAADDRRGPFADAVSGHSVGHDAHAPQRLAEHPAQLGQAGAVLPEVGGRPLSVGQSEAGGDVRRMG